MRLLFISKIETNAGWGFETFLDAALLQCGIETIWLDYHKHRYRIANFLLRMREDFDAVLVERGTGYAIPADVLKAIRRPRIFLFTELVSRHPAQQYMLRDALFDYVFLRSYDCIDFVQERGWLQPSQVGLFLSAISPEVFLPFDGIEQDIDLLFVGTLTPRRQQILAELQREFPITIAKAFGQELVPLINRAKIVLNIHAEEFLDTETRVYETLACEGFLITERLSKESPFTAGVHLVEVDDIDTLKQQISYYLVHKDERRAIANAGREIVLAEHTMQARARQLYTIFSQLIDRSPQALELFDRNLLRRAWLTERYLRVRDPLLHRLGRLKNLLNKK